MFGCASRAAGQSEYFQIKKKTQKDQARVFNSKKWANKKDMYCSKATPNGRNVSCTGRKEENIYVKRTVVIYLEDIIWVQIPKLSLEKCFSWEGRSGDLLQRRDAPFEWGDPQVIFEVHKADCGDPWSRPVKVVSCILNNSPRKRLQFFDFN